MPLFRTTLLCSVLLLAACSDSGSTANNLGGPGDTAPGDNNTNPDNNTPLVNPDNPDNQNPEVGSITISTAPPLELEPLPDVTPASGTDNTGETGGTDTIVSVGDDAAGRPVSSPESGDDGGTTGSGAMIDGGSTAGSTGGDTAGGSGDTGGTDSSTGGSIDGDASDEAVSTDAATRPSVIPPDRPEPPLEPFQAGSLTAADYDDQLNPHLYQRYASDYLQRVGGKLDVPYLDLSNRISLHVTDQQGRRYGGARITVSDANGEIRNLQTPATGITYLYSDIDQLPSQFSIRATGINGTAIDTTIDLEQVRSGRIDIVIPEESSSQSAGGQNNSLDIMFVVDTTGSMGDELNYLQTELSSIINAIPTDRIATNIGLTFYRDIGDEYVVRAHGFNEDINSAQRTLNEASYGGGGDYPEAMDQALHQAIDANWQQDSHKILFLIADAPPHGNKMRATWQAAEQARSKNIHIVPVAASGVAEDAEYLMRSMAAFTNSRYVFLTDDSGFGNSHAEPDVDCYVVTQLNNLMIRVINSLISGVRQEPQDNEIIRSVGNYNEGVCADVFIQ